MENQEPKKSTLGERMGDVSGMRVFRDGKWVLLSDIVKPKSKTKEKKPVTASSYINQILNSSAPVEEQPAPTGVLVPEEQDLAEALISIANKYGKFNEDSTGIWADYHSAEENPFAEMGVKCGNCVLYRGGQECAVVAFDVEPNGYCRFAVIPDGMVDPSKAPDGEQFEKVTSLSLLATAGSKPAPKKDQIKGSDKNAEGSASGSKSITFSKKVENSLAEKVKEHNSKAPEGRKASIRMLKAVYRRGAGAFSSSHRPDQNRNSWAMARVNAFLHLLKSGSPTNKNYTTDYDLLPASHPKSSKKSVTASFHLEYDYDDELSVVLLPETEYTSKEHAIFSLAEYSGIGYEIIPALTASWLRAEKNKENPFQRATELAVNLLDSRDADLLPKEF